MELDQQIQEGNTDQKLPYHTHNGVDSPILTVSESSLNLSDVTTGDATTSRHGLLPKLSGVATEFLDGTGDYDTVKDSDLSTSDITTNDVTTSKHGFTPKAPNDTAKFLRGDASWSIPTVSKVEITVNAGETLVAGEVVTLYKAVGNFATDGYNMVNGTVYAVRAAADDTTYGGTVLGIMTSNATYLGTGTCAVIGDITGLSGLSPSLLHYLINYGASTETISQTTGGSDQSLAPSGFTITQIFQPQSSRLISITVHLKTNGSSQTVTVNVKRHNISLGSATSAATSSTSYVDRVCTFATPIRVYKGETLTFNIDSADGYNASLEYASGTSPYGGGASGGSIPASSDLYFKVNENIGFGAIGSPAGTRKIKLGQALSSTQLALLIQYGDSLI